MYSRGVLKTHTPSHIAAVFENSPEGFFENRFYIYSQYLRELMSLFFHVNIGIVLYSLFHNYVSKLI